MGQLMNALQKLSKKLTVNGYISFETDLELKTLKFEINKPILIATGINVTEVQNIAYNWLKENALALLEKQATRANLTLFQNDEFQSKTTLRIDEILESAEAGNVESPAHIAWQGSELNSEQEEFIESIYKDFYALGEQRISNELFQQAKPLDDLLKRIKLQPDYKNEKSQTEFLQLLSVNDQEVIEKIIHPSSVPGCAVDFAWEIYEKYFDLDQPIQLDDEEIKAAGIIEEDVNNVHYLASSAIGDGASSRIQDLLKQVLPDLAAELLDESQKWREEENG